MARLHNVQLFYADICFKTVPQTFTTRRQSFTMSPHPAAPVPETSKKPEGHGAFLAAVKAVLPVNLLLLLVPRV